MAIRDEIVRLALWWADPGKYKPLPDELVSFFETSGTEQVPTLDEAKKSLMTLSNGVRLGGQVKHWCGIFACHILCRAGVDVKWTFLGGKVVGKSENQIRYVPGRDGMKPGDIAIIPAAQHHFIVIDADYDTNTLHTVDGNTEGQYIREIHDKKIRYTGPNASNLTPYGYYRVLV
ncbi:MAG: hypothetical protein E4H46_01330 [Desulfobacterales bacterium]|nr:MAG: hypothetical protein E4H46_01330 [Desulfobacterales bacterium]